MDIIIRHKENRDNYRVGKDMTLTINGKKIAVTPYASLSKNRETLYLRDCGQFSGFEKVSNSEKESTLNFNLDYFKEVKYKGTASESSWMNIDKESLS